MALTSDSEWTLGPWYVWEHGLLLAPVPIVKKRLHIIGMYSINTSEPRYPKQNYISPPKPISQFLLGSTPTQLEPGFGFLVLRHMRSLTNQPNNWITQEIGTIWLKLRLAFNVKSSRHQTHVAVGVCETIRIGDDLQEDITVVKDVGEDGVTSVISHDLCNRKHKWRSCWPVVLW